VKVTSYNLRYSSQLINAKQEVPPSVVMKILAVSGSLRAASINSMLLRAATKVAPPEISVNIFGGLGELPLFNPDHEENKPTSVLSYLDAVAVSDALLIASPEYAHGVTGAIKNALDWLVGFEPFAGKHVAVINTSPIAHHADEALRETLRTMAAVVVESASITIPLLGAGLDESAMVATPSITTAIDYSLRAIQHAVGSRRGSIAAEFPIR
jgi:chromate reductase, NAD(P)H dehydrogenase (quinone)